MAGVLVSLLSRLGAATVAKRQSERVPISGRAPFSDRVPVIVHDDDDDLDEPTMGGGAAVRHIHCEPEAESDEPTGCAPLFEVSAAGKTHLGMRRRSNEDALLLLRKRSVYAVADGMGGHDGGEIASQLAIEAIATAFLDGVEIPCALTNVPPRAAELVQAIAAANEAIRSAASKDGRLSEMGTTIVAARFCPSKGRLYVAHVGDSRCYRLRDGTLEQITRDHTMAELGVSGREAGYLSRAVGPKGVVEADVAVIEPRPGDVYLLCTDGLTKMVSDECIRRVLLGEETPEEAASMLVARANSAGGRDNVTALVIRIAAPA